MSCVATASSEALRALQRVSPASRSVWSALTEVRRSSYSKTGRLKRPRSWLEKRRQRAVISCVWPSRWDGMPTTTATGRHSSNSCSRALKRPSLVDSCRVFSALALPISSSPTATPMRASPKSKPITVPRAGNSRSGMTADTAELSGLDAKMGECGRESSFWWLIEEDRDVGGHNQPRIGGQFLFELPCGPACVTERNQDVAWRVRIFAQRLQHVA